VFDVKMDEKNGISNEHVIFFYLNYPNYFKKLLKKKTTRRKTIVTKPPFSDEG
jgi:hypothetical protein